MQSPAIPAVASPVSFNGRYNPARQSISVPPGAFQIPQQQPSPHAYSPQAVLLQQGLARGGSPALAQLGNMLISPTSPFSPDGFQPPLHQRHQSLQYPILPHQHFQTVAARASPRLQEVQEVDEELPSKSPSKTPEPAHFIRHNASASLQKEIDEAEYHLEDQMRSTLEHDKDYSPHQEPEVAGAAGLDKPAHAREPSVQFAPQVQQRFRDDAENGPVLHHPRPHSRGHSLANNYFVDQDEVRDSTDEGNSAKLRRAPDSDSHKADDSYEIETNPSNLGTPIQALDFNKVLQQHQRAFSTTSNPWSDAGSVSGKSGPLRRTSHGSKASLSKLNADAAEFKFNPANTSFQPGQFAFGGGNPFQPTVFQAGLGANPSANSSQFSLPTTASSRINANAPIFSPGQSEFSFSTAGPKMRPDAPAFTPFHSFSDSVTSPPQSGSESVGNRASSIFGNIDLNIPDVKPAKKSKAIPIVKPASRHTSPQAGEEDDAQQYDQEGRITDDTRVKRAKASADDGDDVPLFAERPAADDQVQPAPADVVVAGEPDAADPKAEDDESALPEDTTLSSTMASETTDAKATTSPSETSPRQAGMSWAPFEFKSPVDLADFNSARPMGEDMFRRHKKSLSATAQPFVPGAAFDQPAADEAAEESADEPVEEPTLQSVADQVPDEVPADSPLAPAPAPVQDLASSRIGSSPLPARKGLSASRYAESPSPPPAPQQAAPQPAPQPQRFGLSASRYASSPPPLASGAEEEKPTPAQTEDEHPPVSITDDQDNTQESLPQPETLPSVTPDGGNVLGGDDEMDREPTFEEIDDIMRHLNENDPARGVNKTVENPPQWHQPSPARHISLAAVTNTSPLHLAAPQNLFRSDAPSPSPGRYHLPPPEPHQPILSTELEDPFVDPPQSAQSFDGHGRVHRLNGSESLPASDWEGAFSDDEQLKLESRVNFFDGRVNDVVGALLSTRLGPVEKTLEGIQHVLSTMSRATPSSRRDRRSMSAEIQESDADDEDDEMPVPRLSMSPRRDRRMEHIRAAVLEALAIQQRNTLAAPPVVTEPADAESMASVLRSMEEMKEQFGRSLHLDFRGEDLRNIVEDAVERRMPPTPQPVVVPGQEDLSEKYNELQARVIELEQRLRLEEAKTETEVASRRDAEDRAAELHRKLEMAETKIEVEIMNRSAYDQRVVDLEEKLKHQEDTTEAEIQGRRAAEDRLSEVQRLLRISSEEETRLREALEDREQKIKSIEETRGKSTMRLALLEAAQTNGQKTHSDLQNKLNALEVDLRDKSQEARHWRAEAERAIDLSQRQGDDLVQTTNENKHLKKVIDTLGAQLEENERVREGWRGKFISLQEDMSSAAREIAEENARRTKKEQALIARHEVLDAKLQAEARTRERLESELERLEGGERQGMRAVSECKRLEGLLAELRTENHKLQLASMAAQAEVQEAREAAAREVQRTRESLQGELETANDQVNLVREELEDQMMRLRAQLDQVKLDADTTKARHDMLLEEADNTKRTDLEALERKHQNEMEDVQARYERQINNTTEDAQRTEQNLLERLSISASKSEHLQDRVAHLEEKLEIANEAAKAAARAAKSPVPAEPALQAAAPIQAKSAARHLELPEKISPQALRESIMVLQEQLQEREQRIEELEAAMAKLDPDAEIKISKRDDEITWLRELLAVRHSDLQDIITALGRDDYDGHRVRDAAIRLKANLQMEEQERERALNGGSAITLPNIAASIRDAATPRVAQAVGPLAAAWGNWRKGRDPASFGSLSGVLSSPAAASTSATPSKSSPGAQSSFLSGLLTPPTSTMRQTPPTRPGQSGQPTAFSATGRRFTSDELASRARGSSMTSRQAEKMPGRGTPPHRQSRAQPVTPPMMRSSAYDSDAQAEDFDAAGFFDD